MDVEEEPKVKEYFGISEVPAALLYMDGKQVEKVEGKGAGIEVIEKLLS